MVELFHGYTYSAHPLACAAGLATLDLYRDEDLFERAKTLEPLWADAAMSAQGPAQRARHPLRRPHRRHRPRLAARRASASAATTPWSAASTTENLVIRVTGDTIALTPPLIVSEREIEEIFAKVARVIRAVA